MIVNRGHWLLWNLLEDYFDADLNAVAITAGDVIHLLLRYSTYGQLTVLIWVS